MTLSKENGGFNNWRTGLVVTLCHWTRTIKRVKTMGLLTILKKMKQKEKEMRILMLYPS